jgi:hypothetical protein
MVAASHAAGGTGERAFFEMKVWMVPALLVNMSGAVSVASATRSF